MDANGRDDGRMKGGTGLLAPVAASGQDPSTDRHDRDDFVYDFTGLHRPKLLDLAMILTARLRAGPDDRVWVRALPPATERVLGALGLSHLFRHYPGTNGDPN